MANRSQHKMIENKMLVVITSFGLTLFWYSLRNLMDNIYTVENINCIIFLILII